MNVGEALVTEGKNGRNLLTVTMPDGVKFSHDHEWVKAEIRAIETRKAGTHACACSILFPHISCERGPHPINFFSSHPSLPGKEGDIVVVSYERGGDVVQFKNGAWITIGQQPSEVKA